MNGWQTKIENAKVKSLVDDNLGSIIIIDSEHDVEQFMSELYPTAELLKTEE